MASHELHKGHRQRLIQKYLQFGAEALEDHELLELLLFFSVPRVNTNNIAHSLLNEFGSLEKVFEAEFEQLTRVHGIGEHSATLLTLTGDISKRFTNKPAKFTVHYNKLSLIGRFLIGHFENERIEKLCALFFDSSMKLISINTIAEGDAHASSASTSAIARLAVLKDASAVVIAHNHTNGSYVPSSSDRNFTHLLEASLYSLGIPLIEHIIVADDTYSPIMMVNSGSTRFALATTVLGNSFFNRFYSE